MYTHNHELTLSCTHIFAQHSHTHSHIHKDEEGEDVPSLLPLHEMDDADDSDIDSDNGGENSDDGGESLGSGEEVAASVKEALAVHHNAIRKPAGGKSIQGEFGLERADLIQAQAVLILRASPPLSLLSEDELIEKWKDDGGTTGRFAGYSSAYVMGLDENGTYVCVCVSEARTRVPLPPHVAEVLTYVCM